MQKFSRAKSVRLAGLTVQASARLAAVLTLTETGAAFGAVVAGAESAGEMQDMAKQQNRVNR